MLVPHHRPTSAPVRINDGNATRIAQTARAEVAVPLALAALLPLAQIKCEKVEAAVEELEANVIPMLGREQPPLQK